MVNLKQNYFVLVEHLYVICPYLLAVLSSEYFVDWIKHAFITKFNNIPVEVCFIHRCLILLAHFGLAAMFLSRRPLLKSVSHRTCHLAISFSSLNHCAVSPPDTFHSHIASPHPGGLTDTVKLSGRCHKIREGRVER